MTPAARYAAAIDVLDRTTNGQSSEKAIMAWGRSNRYAGSKDRAAVRDHVYDILRQKRSLAHLGGGVTARALVLGLLRVQGIDPNNIFGSGGYSPDALSLEEEELTVDAMPESVAMDLPDWLWPIWTADLGDAANSSAHCLQSRAPIALRINLGRGSLSYVQAELGQEGIETQTIDAVPTALLVIKNARRLRHSKAFIKGLFDMQDISSQNAVASLSVRKGARVLDYCAGGGGKALAIADMHDAIVTAHDIVPERTIDIAPRAARADVKINLVLTHDLILHAPFDLVFCDVPCSGSGTWRRTPESKWTLTINKLNKFSSLQRDVIEKAASYVATDGKLVYATCSVLRAENNDVVDAFVADYPNWICERVSQQLPSEINDGFFFAILRRAQINL